jgi:hypothetical protein
VDATRAEVVRAAACAVFRDVKRMGASPFFVVAELLYSVTTPEALTVNLFVPAFRVVNDPVLGVVLPIVPGVIHGMSADAIAAST